MTLVQRIIAIGSAHGDDQLAWRLAERLQSRQEMNARVVALRDPTQLHDYVADCDRLIVIDACASDGSPGTITRMEWPDSRIDQRPSNSSHGIGVAATLRLAEQLGELPSQVVIFGIEIAQCQPVDSLSDTAERALNELEEKILLEIQ